MIMDPLYNPLIGSIPLPEKDSSQVKNELIPMTNYGAKQVAPQYTNPFIVLLEWDSPGNNPGSDTGYTTQNTILTGILINRYLFREADTTNCAFDIFINSEKIISFNDVLSTTGGQINQDFFIPINNWFLGTNTRLRVEGSRGDDGGTARINVSFIGFVPLIQ